MDKQGNLYTFLYASIIVIIVATLLSFASQILKPRQTTNELVARKIDILQSANIASTNNDASEKYKQFVGERSYVYDFKGQIIEDLDALEVDMIKEARKPLEERAYPVYEVDLENGEKKYVLQMRGNGLWGPIWGYISVDNDGSTIYGATFGHQGETPGLGAEISGRSYQEQFKGKKIFDELGNLTSIMVVKGGPLSGTDHAVDAVSGGTITSNGLEKMMKDYFSGYEQLLKNIERNNNEE